jgi:CRISPR-associated protein Cmr2
MTNSIIWQTKLHARLHDPAEKALVLLRDPAGHENGTSRAVHRLLGFEQLPAENIDPDNTDVLHQVLFKNGIPRAMYDQVKRADWWAAAADRPQWPMQEITVQTQKGAHTFKVADFAQVRWAKEPVLIHPLSGQSIDLKWLNETDLQSIKQSAFDHLSTLVLAIDKQKNAEHDWKRLLLAIWRFGPEISLENDHAKIGELWKLLPADTRVPDHSIWDHLDLTSAFAGAFAADTRGEAALLSLALGPVQSFIAAARSTSDLWAGSHLLSRMAWEAMKPICEAIGPDAILFPRLRGIPQVDLWLKSECDLPGELFEDCEWNQAGNTDANPLFAAALPNRFVAIVPAEQLKTLAAKCEAAVQAFLLNLGFETVDQLLQQCDLKTANAPRDTSIPAYQQVQDQLKGFPEVHWAGVPFTLIRPKNTERQTDLDVSLLQAAMAPYFGTDPTVAAGFLTSDAWKVLQSDCTWSDQTTFFSPNPGVLYPAIYDLADRLLASAKGARTFAAQDQTGWRDSLTGEVEWLTHDRKQLKLTPGQRDKTLWAIIAKNKPAWAKQGEHLGALSAIKRLWPTIFAQEAGAIKGETFDRFVVSTHTMALASTIDKWLDSGAPEVDGLREFVQDYLPEPVALPTNLALKARGSLGTEALSMIKKLPNLFDLLKEGDQTDDKARRIISKILSGSDTSIENYYALILLDGDRLGAILSGDIKHAISYKSSFHPRVQLGFAKLAHSNPALQTYGDSKRALSPNRHLAISTALNDFSQTVVRHIVEREFMGKLIYSGGDDVLAMVSVTDLLPCLDRLRQAYCGGEIRKNEVEEQKPKKDQLKIANGFAYLNGRVMRMMGSTATASAGAVIVHHQTPLSIALSELRAAESRAKNEGGRNAFSLALIKRSGGQTNFTAKWDPMLQLLVDTRTFLENPSVSRRAVYLTMSWLIDLPNNVDTTMLSQLLCLQFKRQTREKEVQDKLPLLCEEIAQAALKQGDKWQLWLTDFLSCAEFLARKIRGTTANHSQESPSEVAQ